MPESESQSGFTFPTWIAPTLAGLAISIASWSWGQNLANERRFTQLETWITEHEKWSALRSQNTNDRLEKMDALQTRQAEKTREVVDDLREDAAAIRGALKIQK